MLAQILEQSDWGTTEPYKRSNTRHKWCCIPIRMVASVPGGVLFTAGGGSDLLVLILMLQLCLGKLVTRFHYLDIFACIHLI